MKNIKRIIYAFVGVTLLGLAGTANAATVFLTSLIDGAQANAGAGTMSPGTGSATMSLDTVTREFRWEVSWQGLLGTVSVAHFHGPAVAGANAGVQVTIDHTQNPSPGTATLTVQQAADLLAGLWYINIHSSRDPGGEIRGQVNPPGTSTLLNSSIDGAQANAGAGTGSTGMGSAAMQLETSTRVFSWSVNWGGLTGTVTVAHFHGPAAPGTNAGVQVTIDHTQNPSLGTASLTTQQTADLLAGLWYINIHSTEDPGGEIRGQVQVQCGSSGPLVANRWTQIGLDCASDSPGTVESTFGDDLTPADLNNTWSIFERDSANDSYIRLGLDSVLSQNRGYWLRSSAAANWDIAGVITPVIVSAGCTSATGCLEINLTPPDTPGSGGRFNLIGHPFPRSIDWANVRVVFGGSALTPSAAETASVMSKVFWVWSGADYDQFDDSTPGLIGTLAPGGGLWVRVLDGAVGQPIKLLIPAQN